MGTELYTPSSNSIIHNTKVDFTNRLILQKTINLVQYDRNMPIIAVSLYKNGVIYSLPVGMTVKIRWGKKDRTFVYKEALGCNTGRNIIYFDVDEQMTYFHGKLDPIIELVDSSGSTPAMAGSSSIPVVIEKNPIQETDIESSNEYVDLLQAVADAQQAVQDAEEIVSRGDKYEPDGLTIVLNEDDELEVNLKYIMDGGYL